MLRCNGVFAFGFLLISALRPATAVERIELLDGTELEAAITSIDSEGKVVGNQLEAKVNIRDIRTILRSATEPGTATGSIVIDLSAGGRIQAMGITLADEKCEIAWGPDGTIEVPIDVVRAIRFDSKPAIATFQSALAKRTAGYDRLFIKDGERVQQIAGLIEKVTAESVVFLRDDKEVQLPRARVYGIALADVGETSIEGAPCRVTLRDSSIIPGSLAKLADDVLTLKMSRTVDLALSWDAVSRIDIQSPRLTFLSDLKPDEVVQQSIVVVPRTWQRDRNVTGGDLTLNSAEAQTNKTIEFKKGIGTHSRCRLSYDIDGAYDTFLAIVGIDAGTRGKGDCIVSVVGDDKPLYSQRVTGQDKRPHEIRVDLTGVRRLTIVVEPGQDLDLADHLNWCDARLIRKPS